jgi:hypothetical protein
LGRNRQPLAVRGRLNHPAKVIPNPVQVFDEGEASQRAKTSRLQGTRNIVNPTPTQPFAKS